jgi:hypothetical protein
MGLHTDDAHLLKSHLSELNPTQFMVQLAPNVAVNRTNTNLVRSLSWPICVSVKLFAAQRCDRRTEICTDRYSTIIT